MRKKIYIIVTAVHQQEVSDLFKNFPENNFIYPLLQVGSGSPKINGSDRIQIIIPAIYTPKPCT